MKNYHLYKEKFTKVLKNINEDMNSMERCLYKKIQHYKDVNSSHIRLYI